MFRPWRRIRFMEANLIFFVILVLGTCSGESEDLEAPYIYPSAPTLEVDPGSDISLACHGSAPVTWRHDMHEGLDRLTIVETNFTKPLRFVSQLNITNVIFQDLGNYECHYADAKLDKNAGGAYVYIFVLDNEHLLVHRNEEDTAVVTATKGMPHTFGFCKPTHPSVSVKLSIDGNIIDPSSDPSVTYSDQTGFTIKRITTRSNGQYACIGEKGNKKEEVHFYVHVIDNPEGIQPEYIRSPTIDSTLAKGVSVGGTFILDCSADTPTTAFYSLQWAQPEEVINSPRAKTEQTDLSTLYRKKYRLRLTVVNATKEDGNYPYECYIRARNVNKSSFQNITIFGKGDEYLHVNASKDGNITVNASKEAKWVIEAHGFPMPTEFIWKSPKGNDLGNVRSRFKKNIDPKSNQIVLSITDVSMADGGMYKFIVSNNYDAPKTIDLFLTVRAAPEVIILQTNTTTKPFFQIGEQHTFRCRANGFPYPNITWYFQACNVDLTTCDNDFKPLAVNGKLVKNIHENAPRHTSMDVLLNITSSGNLKCFAKNSIGGNDDIKSIVGVDFPDKSGSGFATGGPVSPIQSDNVEYLCAVSRVNFTDHIIWYYKNTSNLNAVRKPIHQMKGVSIVNTSTIWSYQKTLRIIDVQLQFNGEYTCEVDLAGDALTSSFVLRVRETQIPEIYDTNLNGTKISVGPGDKVDALYCNATGVPAPIIYWEKNGVQSDDWNQEHIYIKDDKVILGFLKSEHSGQYKCIAKNRVGQDSRFIDIDVQVPWTPFTIVFVICSLIILLVLGLCLFHKMRRERKMEDWLRKLHLQDFENGDIEKINPEEDVESQVNLLPYDKIFEFPRSRLKLGVQLGSGAFGRVVRAEATGITKGEPMTVVAVKMVKPNAEESHFKALMSELKIMIHLGQHVNVVNLLGACTKDLMKKRELLVIVEYCKYGSLLAYMHRHRNEFIDQLDRTRDTVDPNICYPVGLSTQAHNRLNYAALTFSDGGAASASRTTADGYHTMDQITSDQNGFELPSTSSPAARSSLPEEYVLSAHVQSVCTDMSYVSNAPTVQTTDGKRRSSSSSTWTGNGHYRGIYQYRDVQPITTTDLLCWSFQISRGMEYLSSRKILHGDLAARNVLLTDRNVVKICDFGLAKEMYHEKYKKKSEGVLLPVKWMAIESICLGVFSTQSDVWSFGVVMWELFTLGKTPYPGMDADERFYKMLNDGYRMEKPAFAPSSVYDLMSDCWNHEPSARPSFTALTDRIGDLMQEGLRQHYIDLNYPYTTMNEKRMEGREDYLLKMSGPDFGSVSKRGTPDRSYANVPEQSSSGYLIPDAVIPGHSNNLLRPPTLAMQDNYQNVTVPSQEDQRLHCLANNTGYLYMNRNSSDSPGPIGIFSPRPEQLSGDSSEFNFGNKDCPRPSTADKTENSSSLVAPSSPAPREVEGISNIHYVPDTIFSSADSREMQDQLLEAAKASYKAQSIQLKEPKKRQKNDSGISSIDSNYESNNTKAASPPPPYVNSFSGGTCTDSKESSQSQNHIAGYSPPTILAGGRLE